MCALAQARLEEVHGERPAEVQQRDHGEDDPGADDGPAGPARLLSRVAVADERASWARGLFRRARHQKIFSIRSEEHTSELQSHSHLGCRLLPDNKKEEE